MRHLVLVTTLAISFANDALAQCAARVNPYNAAKGHFSYTLTINDQNSFSMGPMNSSVSIDMVATSDLVTGTYTGESKSATTNNMSTGGATISAPFTTSIKNLALTFVRSPTSAPVWLDMRASGSMPVTSDGVGTVSAGGGGTSVKLSTSASVPYEIRVVNQDATLTITIPNVPVLRFKGKLSWQITPRGMADLSHDMARGEAPAGTNQGSANPGC